MEEGREAERSLMKREKSIGPRTDPCRTPQCTLEKAHKHACRVRQTKQESKPVEMSFCKKGGVPDRVESFRELFQDCSENLPRVRFWVC